MTPTPERIAEIRARLDKRNEPTLITCQACGQDQPITGWAVPMAHGLATEAWRCVRCGGQMFLTVTIGGDQPLPDDDIRDLLAALDAATAERDAAERAAAVVAVDFVTVSDARDVALARAEALESELSRLRALTTWQPIETAPKDGTFVLLYERIKSGVTNSVQQFTERRVAGRWTTAYDGTEDGWYGGGWRSFPTHWQPLPAPPAEDRAKEGR